MILSDSNSSCLRLAGAVTFIHYLKTSNRIIHFIPQIMLTLHPTLMAIFITSQKCPKERVRVENGGHLLESQSLHIHTEAPSLDHGLKEVLNI